MTLTNTIVDQSEMKVFADNKINQTLIWEEQKTLWKKDKKVLFTSI